MNERVEVFLDNVLTLAGEPADAVREEVRGMLSDCEQLFRAQEANKWDEGRSSTRMSCALPCA
jgi:hypothetical protein